jgi:hypothetical protein
MRFLIGLLVCLSLSFSAVASERNCRGIINTLLSVEFLKSSISSFSINNISDSCSDLLDKEIELILNGMEKNPQVTFNKDSTFIKICDSYCSTKNSNYVYYPVSQIKSAGPVIKNDIFFYVPINFLNVMEQKVFFPSKEKAESFLEDL